MSSRRYWPVVQSGRRHGCCPLYAIRGSIPRRRCLLASSIGDEDRVKWLILLLQCFHTPSTAHPCPETECAMPLGVSCSVMFCAQSLNADGRPQPLNRPNRIHEAWIFYTVYFVGIRGTKSGHPFARLINYS